VGPCERVFGGHAISDMIAMGHDGGLPVMKVKGVWRRFFYVAHVCGIQ